MHAARIAVTPVAPMKTSIIKVDKSPTVDLDVIRSRAGSFAHSIGQFTESLSSDNRRVAFTPHIFVKKPLFVDNNQQAGTFFHEYGWIILGNTPGPRMVNRGPLCLLHRS